MDVAFTPRISWNETVNQAAFQFDKYKITPPRGLSAAYVKTPKFVNAAEMVKLARESTARNTAGGLATVEGLTTKDFTINYADPERQWPALPGPDGAPATQGPAKFQFQGGEVFLDLSIGLYITEYYKPGGDAKSVKIFKILYEHELLHVLDETDIMTNWLPQNVVKDSTIDKYFVKREPAQFGLATQSVAEARTEFLSYIGQQFILSLWAEETNRRGALRDAPNEYRKVADAIYAIRYGSGR
jgi:hypothetical protein